MGMVSGCLALAQLELDLAWCVNQRRERQVEHELVLTAIEPLVLVMVVQSVNILMPR